MTTETTSETQELTDVTGIPMEIDEEISVPIEDTAQSDKNKEGAPVVKTPPVKITEQISIDEIWDDLAVQMAFPSDTNARLGEQLGKLPNVDILTDEKSRNWGSVLRDGQDLATHSDIFIDSFEREGASFEQGIEFNNAKLQAAAPRLKNVENETIHGERAILRVCRDLGLGTTFQVPCWHSGIWVTFKPPTELELIELNRAMVASKIRLGYSTYGLAFSNVTSYTVDHLTAFMLSHIYATTMTSEDLPLDKLFDHLYVQDLYTLVWGLACTMYPRGFQIRRACISDPEKCNHVTEETINLFKLQTIDTSQLNERQKAHMSGRAPFGKNMASVKSYIDDMVVLKNNRVKVSRESSEKEVWVNLKSPTIREYIDEGYDWIGSIIDNVNNALKDTSPDMDRNILVQRHGQASSMRQYNHWVESIEIGSNLISDKETIRKTLDIMSSDDYLRETFISEVVKYINRTTISVIGIPVYECPKCGKEQQDADITGNFKNVIPLDTIQYFFSLITQRIQRIAIR